jgi:alginate O-acetyltransferase complex protein AlgJ
MALLARCRRAWMAIFVGLLWLPIFGQAFQPANLRSEAEARMLRMLPKFTKSMEGLASFPKSIEGFLADHFGFRAQLIHANAFVRYKLSSPTSPYVLYGRDGFLFYLEHRTLEQSMGLVIRNKPLERLADFLAQLHLELSRRNIRFLFTSPPSNSTINRRRLPAWAATPPAVAEYDVLLQLLAARGVPALDLRPALQTENSARATYFRTDTHWNFLGAVIARNEIVRAVGHPEWMLDISRIFRGFRRTYGSDLPRLLGVSNHIAEDQDAEIDVSSYPNSEGPRVLVIGDSFTSQFFPMIWRNGGQPFFMENPSCKVDVEVIAAHRPSIVILSIAERALALLC